MNQTNLGQNQPQPQNTSNHPAKFAFFYMLSLVALVIMSFSTGLVIFQIINKYIADTLSFRTTPYSPEAIRFALSGILVAAPIYYLVMHQIQKSLASGALSLEAGVRKWLTYFILFVSATVSIGWLMATVNNFLNGELTLKFILKALTAIGISGAVFAFYLYDIKRRQIDERSKNIVRWCSLLSLAVILATFVAGIIIESPLKARARRHDKIVVERLERIASALDNYYYDYQKLPDSLDEVVKNNRYYLDEDILRDPVSRQPFEYEKISDNSYKICASFELGNRDEQGRYDDKRWLHDPGYQCFKKEVFVRVEPRPIK
jgi:hypothetical protein